MKSRVGILLMVRVAGVACAGGAALATDYDWVGQAGPVASPNDFSDAANWSPGGGPPGSADHALVDPDDSSLCIVDDSGGVTVTDLDLAGDSPTKMRLHVRDGTLDATSRFVISDYGFVDAEKNFTVGVDTVLSDSVWISVASGVTVDLGALTDVVSLNAYLNLANTSGTCTTEKLRIDAAIANPDETRILKFDGGDMDVDKLDLKGDEDVNGDKYAKLWLARGSITAGTADFDGGDNTNASVRIDMDDTLTVTGDSGITGIVKIDVASGKTMDAGEMVISSEAILTKTGVGTLESS